MFQGVQTRNILFTICRSDLVIHEFIGLHEVSVNTGENLARVVTDVRETIWWWRTHGWQTSGAQAIIKKKQPLTPYIHCGSHWGNLITQHACTASGVIHSALQLVHEFGILFGQSGNLNLCSRKLQNLFQVPTNLLCPLCPTRWAVRSSTIMLCWINVTLMLALNEIAAGSSDTANRANGLHERFQQGNVL